MRIYRTPSRDFLLVCRQYVFLVCNYIAVHLPDALRLPEHSMLKPKRNIVCTPCSKIWSDT
jgi:hypothetical protein